jgi:hypothetical protein
VERPAEIAVGFIKFGVQLDGLEKRFRRRLQISVAGEREPEGVVRLGVSRLKLDRLPELRDRVGRLFLFQERYAFVKVPLGHGRRGALGQPRRGAGKRA